MSLPALSGGFAICCGAALFSWLAVATTGALLRRHALPLYPVLTALGSLLLLLAACCGNHILTIPLPLFLGNAPIALTADPLSRWFLAMIGILGFATALFAPGYMLHLRHRISLGFVWAALALLLISMAGVVLAANALVFLVAWEVMALSSFALVAADHEQHAIRRAALIYLGATRVGTAFLMGGFLWAHHLTGSWAFADWHMAGAAALLPAVLIFIGLATKAGCWPFHLWLPIAHPAAPAPVSAIMSGVMIKTAIYAMLRLFVVDAHLAHPALGPLILILGSISAVWGLLFALLQHDLKRLLAYSSVENIGIMLMGIGVALIGAHYRLAVVAQLGLAATLLHAMNHALFKGLLFLGTGAIDAQTHQRDAERLGGLIHRMPWTAACFLVGSAAICALPPLNGFVSEWLLYQGFFQMALDGPSVGMRLGALLLIALLALVGALALACFVKAVGVVFLGVPRSKAAEQAREVAPGMLAAQVLLAAGCVGLGLAGPVLLTRFWSLAPAINGAVPFASLWTIPMPVMALLLVTSIGAVTVLLALAASRLPVRRYITWECGFGALSPRTQYTAASFAQPISRLFGLVYNYAISVQLRGRQRNYFPDTVDVSTTHEPYLETRIYGPLLRSIQRLGGSFLMRLQAGSIHQYLLYMALVLALLLWVGYR